MPWKIETHNDEYCVIKKDDGEVEGCHSSPDAAKSQLAALYASEKGFSFFDLMGDIVDKVKSAFAKDTPTPTPIPDPTSTFTLTKQSDGTYTWTAIWTNKYRDDDNPPEILADVAHREFVKAVDAGEWPLPELQLWHIPGSRFGSTNLVAYDTDSGFSIAAGRIDKGKERVAEIILSLPTNQLAVSHGMPIAEIERDTADKSVIVRYRTKEISLLPLHAAANKLTSFELLGGNMLEPKGSEEKLQTFLGKDKADEVMQTMNLKGQEAAESGLEFKDAVEEEVEEVVEEIESPEDAPKSADPIPDPITREEIKEAMQELASMILSEVKSLNEQTQATYIAHFDEFKSELDVERKAAEDLSWTSRLSLKDMIANTAIGSPATYVDGRTKEARDKPKEAEETKESITRDPLTNDIFNVICSGKFNEAVGGNA